MNSWLTPKLNGDGFVYSSRASKMVFFLATERACQSEKLLNGLPSSLRAMACVRDIWASRSKTSVVTFGSKAATCPSAQVAVVLPTPPLKLIVAIDFNSPSWLWRPRLSIAATEVGIAFHYRAIHDLSCLLPTSLLG